MTFKLEFLPSALKEWEKLGHTIRAQLKKSFSNDSDYQEFQAMRFMACQIITKSNCAVQDTDSSIESRKIG